MDYTKQLTQGFLGAAEIAGLPLYVKNGVWFMPGMIADSTYTAYFGRVVSSDEATPGSFLMGLQGEKFVGVLVNEAGVNQNEPAKNDSRLYQEPATAIVKGAFFIKGWTHAASGALTTPTRTSTIIFSNTTGAIEFIASTSSIPSGWSQLPGEVMLVDTSVNGALIFLSGFGGASSIEGLPTLPFQTDNSATVIRAMNFESLDLSSKTNTDGTIISTGTTWLIHETAEQCAVKILAGTEATTGDYATLRIRARSDGIITTNPVGVVAGNFAASANVNDYANLYAVQGYAQPLAKTQSLADNIVCALYGCVQRTAASVGSDWCLWVDTHATVKATGGTYLARFSHNGGAINLDGIFTIYAGQGCDYLFNFENTNAPIVARDSDGGTATYSIQCYVDGAIRYIQLYDAA